MNFAVSWVASKATLQYPKLDSMMDPQLLYVKWGNGSPKPPSLFTNLLLRARNNGQ